MPNYAQAPDWYAGPGGWINQLMQQMNAFRNQEAAYVPYPGVQVAPLNPLQQQAEVRAMQENQAGGGLEFQHRLTDEAAAQARQAVNPAENVRGQIQPFIDRGIADPTANIDQYMNPYQQRVVNQIARQGERNLQENILPNVRDTFIRAGQYGGTGHQNLTNRAIRDTQESILNKQGELMHQGYGQALGVAQAQQGRNLEAGRAVGAAQEADVGRRLEAGRLMPLIGGARQEADFRNIGNLMNVGQMGAQNEQQRLNAAHQGWVEQRNYPYAQLERIGALAHGFHGNVGYNPYQVAAPGVNPYGVAGAQMGQAWHQQQAGRKAGGYVKMASGGVLNQDMGQHDNGTTPSYDQMAMQEASQANMMPLGAINPNRGQAGLVSRMYQREPTYAQGGSVHEIKHYADGGGVPESPIKRGVNDAWDTSNLNQARKQALDRVQQEQMAMQQQAFPQWDFNQPYTKGRAIQDLQMMQNRSQELMSPNQRYRQPDPYHMAQAAYHGAYAARTEPGAASWGKAIQEGGKEFERVSSANRAENITREERSDAFNNLIGNTLRSMADKHEKFELDKLQNDRDFGIKTQEMGMKSEEHGWKKQKFDRELEAADMTRGMMEYNPKLPLIQKDKETGAFKAVPIVGLEVSRDPTAYEKQYAKKMAEKDAETKETTDAKAENAYLENQRLDDIIENAPKAKPGAFNTYKHGLSKVMKDIGADDETLEMWNLPDPKAQLQSSKTMNEIVMGRVKAMGGRILVTEIEGFRKALPTMHDTPEAIVQVSKVMKLYNEYDIAKSLMRDRWEENFGSIRNKSANGKTFGEYVREETAKTLFPQLKELQGSNPSPENKE